MNTELQYKYQSPIGTLYLVAGPKGLKGLFWVQKEAKLVKDLGTSAPEAVLKKAASQLDQYFAGKRQAFDLPLDFEGTNFQNKVWKTLQKIPFGKTISYKELALKVGSPKAVRAVGTANGRNPLSIIIPCHRVIASDGSLGGYAGGLEIKTYLLRLETP